MMVRPDGDVQHPPMRTRTRLLCLLTDRERDRDRRIVSLGPRYPNVEFAKAGLNHPSRCRNLYPPRQGPDERVPATDAREPCEMERYAKARRCARCGEGADRQGKTEDQAVVPSRCGDRMRLGNTKMLDAPVKSPLAAQRARGKPE